MMPTPPEPQSHRMDDLHISEISGVDYPAHLADGWLVLKAKSTSPSQGGPVPIDKDALDPAIAAHITELESQVTKALEAKTEAETALAAATPTPEVLSSDDEILKAMPAPVREMIEKAQARAEAAEKVALFEQDTRLTQEFVSKARDLDALPGVDAEAFGLVLKAVAASAPDVAADVFLVLKSANAALHESGAFKATGTGSSGGAQDAGTAWAQIESIAKAKTVADPAISFSEAVSLVTQERSDLYSQHLTESRKGA